MHRVVHLALLGLVAVVLSAQAAAGQRAYTRSATDTLRYQEVTQGEVTMQAPQGTFTVHTEHDATIAVAFAGGDTAIAWYEALMVSSASAMGDQRPPTDELLGEPYILRFPATGSVTTLSTPTMPPAIAAVTDLTRQFDDFFISVPESGLEIGKTWADTLVRSRTNENKDRYSTRNERQFTVERDTVVDGVDALVISVQQQMYLEASSPLEDQGLTTEVTLEGEDTGIAVFAPRLGRLLGRTRHGEMAGMLDVRGGPQAMKMTQSYTYSGTIEHVEVR